MNERRCSQLQTALTVPNNLNDSPQFVAEASDICANRLYVGLGDNTLLTNYELVIGSLSKLGTSIGYPPGGVQSAYPGGPVSGPLTNVEAFVELQNNNDALAYYQAPSPFGFISTIPLLNVRYCFECKKKDTIDPPIKNGELGGEGPLDPCASIAPSIQIDGTIIDSNTGLSVSQGCCTRDLDINATWGNNPSSVNDENVCYIFKENTDPCKGLVPSILIDGTIIDSNTGLSVPKACCTRDLDANAVWGQNPSSVNEGPDVCYVFKEEIPCDNSALSITEDGVVIGINSRNCCTKDVVGQPVTWTDGKCLIDKGPCEYRLITIGPSPEYQIFGDGNPIKESCCTKEIVGSDVVWENYEVQDATEPNQEQATFRLVPMCRAVVNEPPNVQITLNEEPIETEECDDIITSLWIYFGEPKTVCDTSGDTPQPTGPATQPTGPVTQPPTPSNDPVFDTFRTAPPTEPFASPVVSDDSICCYDKANPIIGTIKVDNPNVGVETIAVFNSDTDGFDTWAGLTANLTNTLGNPFNLILEFTGGLSDCCDYDIHIDDMRIDCFKDEDRVVWKNNDCPGFDIKHVIDNKKSWVYNPGLATMGNSEYDNITRKGGDYSLIRPFATINRTFAPSPDAELPWRYTDYLQQSGILEGHSKLVLNSKEVFLTFNMCTPKDCNISGNTVTLLQLEDYKKVFQSFWVQMVEQFIPATTIFVAGEKWCNAPDIICSEFEECDYDFEFVEGEVTSIVFETDGSDIPQNGGTNTTVPTENDGGFTNDNQNGGTPYTTNDGPIITDNIFIVPTEPELGLTTTESGNIPPDSLVAERLRYLNKFTSVQTEIIFE